MKKITKLFIPLILLFLCFNGLNAQDSIGWISPKFGTDGMKSTQFWGFSPMFTFNTITEDDPTEIIAFSTPFGFDTRRFSIVATASPIHGGTVSGQGTYTSQQIVALIAEPNVGYHFVNWTEAGEEVSTDAIYSFGAHGNRELVAHFEESHTPGYFTLILKTLPQNNAGGGAFGGGTYPAGTQVTITANPNINFDFLEWRDEAQNPISQQAQYSFTLNANRVITAVFGGESYTIATTSDTQHGSTSGDGTYFINEIVQVQAQATENYQFLRWMEGEQQLSVLANYLFSALSDRTLNAEFMPDWNTSKENNALITATSQPSHIGVVLNQGYHTIGTTITLTASPNTGLDFVKWTENGLDIVDENQNLVGMEYSFEVDGDRELVAIFGGETYDISLEANPEDVAMLAGEGEYYHGDFAFVEVLEHEGYDFYNWTQNQQQLSVNSRFGFTVTQDRLLMANFVPTPAAIYSLTLSVYPVNTGTVTGMGSYEAGADVELSAVAAEGFKFVKWTDSQDVQISNQPEFTFTMPEGNVSLTAHFIDAVSVAEINPSQILIFPNPTREYVNIVADVVIQKITITDITGKNALYSPVMEKQTRMATHTLEYGIYLVHIYTEQGVFVRKLQITR